MDISPQILSLPVFYQKLHLLPFLPFFRTNYKNKLQINFVKHLLYALSVSIGHYNRVILEKYCGMIFYELSKVQD